MTFDENLKQFAAGRFGMFCHFGLYSLLGRGEWVLNREGIPVDEYRKLADRFLVPKFDADALARLAKGAGAKYLVFTTMHHDGFALYDSAINPFNSVRHGCKRDLVAEVVEACRKHGLRIHLYHSLNHWTCKPDGCDALEDPKARKQFVDYAHARIRELATKFNPIDCMWYDGWWPFDAEGWRAEEMNAMVRKIQPHILFNGRNGLPGDFATPEQHLGAPKPYRPWEACITHNQSWGYCTGDTMFKSTAEVLDMLTQVAGGAGNLLMNVGPDGEGAVPPPSVAMLQELGQWLAVNGEAIYASEPIGYDLQVRGEHRGDWSHLGKFTTRGNTLYMHVFRWPGEALSVNGMETKEVSCRLLGSSAKVTMKRDGRALRFAGLPKQPPHRLGGVLAIEFAERPMFYNLGGLRVPKVPHPRYDPCPSDLLG